MAYILYADWLSIASEQIVAGCNSKCHSRMRPSSDRNIDDHLKLAGVTVTASLQTQFCLRTMIRWVISGREKYEVAAVLFWPVC